MLQGSTVYSHVQGLLLMPLDNRVLFWFLQAGSYTVTYTAEDAAGNVATAIRVVKVVSPCTGVEHFCSATCR